MTTNVNKLRRIVASVRAPENIVSDLRVMRMSFPPWAYRYERWVHPLRIPVDKWMS